VETFWAPRFILANKAVRVIEKTFPNWTFLERDQTSYQSVKMMYPKRKSPLDNLRANFVLWVKGGEDSNEGSLVRNMVRGESFTEIGSMSEERFVSREERSGEGAWLKSRGPSS